MTSQKLMEFTLSTLRVKANLPELVSLSNNCLGEVKSRSNALH